MRANKRSVLMCAVLAVLSVGAARLGDDSGHLPAADYSKAVFSIIDDGYPPVISEDAENALVFAIEEKETVIQCEPYSDVLEPIIKPPTELTEVYGGL